MQLEAYNYQYDIYSEKDAKKTKNMYVNNFPRQNDNKRKLVIVRMSV